MKARNKAFRQLKKKQQHSMDAMIKYKCAQALVRKTIQTQKRTFWRQYCESIGREVQLSDVCNMIRKMGGIRRNYELPVMIGADRMAVQLYLDC